MSYEITKSCHNENCDNTEAVYVMSAVTLEAGVKTANHLNRTRDDKCPRCGQNMAFFVSEKTR